jgi:hypothetical protein
MFKSNWLNDKFDEEFPRFRDLAHAKQKELHEQARRDRIDRGSSSGPMQVLSGNVKGVVYPFKLFTSDGRVKLYLIKVSESPLRPGDPTTEVEVFWSDNNELNESRVRKLEEDPEAFLIVNHKFYVLGSPPVPEGEAPPRGNGFGGRLVQFRRLTDSEDGNVRSAGPVMATRNLWFSGVIAPAWRDRLPDNATFLDGFDGPGVNY